MLKRLKHPSKRLLSTIGLFFLPSKKRITQKVNPLFVLDRKIKQSFRSHTLHPPKPKTWTSTSIFQTNPCHFFKKTKNIRFVFSHCQTAINYQTSIPRLASSNRNHPSSKLSSKIIDLAICRGTIVPHTGHTFTMIGQHINDLPGTVSQETWRNFATSYIGKWLNNHMVYK